MSASISPEKGNSLTAQPRTLNLSVVRPTLKPARPKRRHVGLWVTFLLIVVGPLLIAAWYLYARANDQYASTMGFSVRSEEVSSPVELFGGLAQMSGSSTSDTDILYEFVRSQRLVESLDARIGLSGLYTVDDQDPVFSLRRGGTIEDLHKYWLRVTRVNYDPGTGLIEMRVIAFDANDARLIAETVFDESANVINQITSIAREDNVKFARAELTGAEERLKSAREALTSFRSTFRLADPVADVEGQMGLLTSLEQTLAEALISYDILRENTRPNDSRIGLAEQRIRIIEDRIDQERSKFGGGTGGSADYSELMGEYERLTVEREIAEEAYALSLAAFFAAQGDAARQSRYLAAHVEPTLAERPEYPQRIMILFVLGAGLFLIWSVGVLIYYSVRDRR